MARHVDELLTAYVHHELHGAELEQVESHLKECRECRQELERIRDVTELISSARILRAPALNTAVLKPRPSPWWPKFAVAATLILALGAFWLNRPDPRIVRTGPSESKQIQIGDIGEVELKPNTEAMMVASSSKQHRMRLMRGELSAKVVAPPRLFVIETPTADAVDLGCAYTLKVDDEGNTLLKVDSGWVALERSGPDSIVPAGWSCKTIKGKGVGTPMCDNARADFRQALSTFDSTGNEQVLSRALRWARKEDALSLWHLLSRTRGARKQVFEVLEKLVPPPAKASRQDLLALNEKSLEAWRHEISYQNSPDLTVLPFGFVVPKQAFR